MSSILAGGTWMKTKASDFQGLLLFLELAVKTLLKHFVENIFEIGFSGFWKAVF
ncbi:MAG: hypothetical protein H6581_20090 [Bacteroidia bacterium]|nr:hypothetical protein [Bacteroidia bacterium]